MYGKMTSRPLLLLAAALGARGQECELRESFILLDFAKATLVRSNLGNVGGRCTYEGACEEMQDSSRPHDIYYRGLATLEDGSNVNLRITNLTEYRAYEPFRNGVKAKAGGAFGVVNLLGPRHWSQQKKWMPHSWQWTTDQTVVQLKYEFLNDDDEPVELFRTFVTFYDFDSGWPVCVCVCVCLE